LRGQIIARHQFLKSSCIQSNLGSFFQTAYFDQTTVVASVSTNTASIVINAGNDTIIVYTKAAVAVSAANSPTVVAVDGASISARNAGGWNRFRFLRWRFVVDAD
jgi:hypothetical protein